jgi:hypothetical protein
MKFSSGWASRLPHRTVLQRNLDGAGVRRARVNVCIARALH